MPTKEFLTDFHWLMDALQSIDVGLVVLDRDYNIQLWNSFMQNHSAMMPNDVLSKNVFKLFSDLPEKWFRRKVETVLTLNNAAFTTWEQRAYLFKFMNYRPITGMADFMYQNSTIIPLKGTDGSIEHICVIIYDVTEVAVNRLQLQEANDRLRLISRTDGLTQLLNRKTWEDELTREFRRYKRHRHACSLMMFDIDHFKKVNDNYGHPAGDAVIRETAARVRESIRTEDIAGRYGGEEFGIIMPETDADGGKILAERIRTAVEKSTVHYEELKIDYTVSIGVARLDDKADSPVAWIERADKALYEAKRSGRNNTVIYGT